jgi:hypothetical protein
MIEYEADFFILRPTEPRRVNGVRRDASPRSAPGACSRPKQTT